MPTFIKGIISASQQNTNIPVTPASPVLGTSISDQSAQQDIAALATSSFPNLPIINLEDFELQLNNHGGPRVLGKGSFGEAVLYRFIADKKAESKLSPEQLSIRKLCDEEGLIVIKRGKIDSSELEVTDYLNQQAGSLYNHARGAKLVTAEGKEEIILLSKYECFCKNVQAEKNKSKNKAYTLKEFLRKMQQVKTKQSLNPAANTTISRAYEKVNADFDISVVQLADTMMASIRAMHQLNVYHLDIALRNFIMTSLVKGEYEQIIHLGVKAMDFGHAERFDASTGLSLNPMHSGGLPIRSMDLATLQKKSGDKYSVRTDLYAYRIALLNMLAINLGYEESAPIFIRPGESVINNYFNRLLLPNDSAALGIYLENMQGLLQQRQDLIDIKKNSLRMLAEAVKSPDNDLQNIKNDLVHYKESGRENISEYRQIYHDLDDKVAVSRNKRQSMIAELANLKQQLNGLDPAADEYTALTQQCEDLEEKCKVIEADIAALISQRDSYLEYSNWFSRLDHLLSNSIAALERSISNEKSAEPASDVVDKIAEQINNLNRALLQHEQTAIDRTRVFIKSYGAYITQAPWDEAEVAPAAVREMDYQRLLRANEVFFHNTLAEKLASFATTEEVASFKLSLQRLLVINVSPEFKATALYQSFAKLLDADNKQVVNVEEIIAALVEMKFDPAVAERMGRALINETSLAPAVLSTGPSAAISDLPLPDSLPSVDEHENPYGEMGPIKPQPRKENASAQPETSQQAAHSAAVADSPLPAFLAADAEHESPYGKMQPMKPLQIKEDASVKPKAELVSLIKPERTNPNVLNSLQDKLCKINQLYKDNARYYHSAFYTALNPLRHRFIKARKENFTHLQKMVQSLQNHLLQPEEMAALMTWSQVANLKNALKNDGAHAIDTLKNVQREFKKLNKKYTSYQKYIDLNLRSFERQLADVDEITRDKMLKIVNDFAAFQAIMLPSAMSEYQLVSQTSQQDIENRINFLAAKIDVAQQKLSVQPRAEERQTANVVVIRAASAPRAEPAAARGETINSAAAGAPASLAEWRGIFNNYKNWRCEKIKGEPHKLKVIPDKSKLSFEVDAQEKSFIYQRSPAVGAQQQSAFSAAETKLIAAMVKAFVATGGAKANISGSPALCNAAAKQLKRYKQISEVIVNGKLVYTAPSVLAEAKPETGPVLKR